MADRLTSAKQIDFTPRGEVLPSPEDWRDQVIYELMIDRFDDGKEHPPYVPGKSKRGVDPAQAIVFQGGTINGVTRRLDYIRDLGASAVWITSPVKNRPNDPNTYHGYGPQDFLAVEPRFGTLEDLQRLVREAHARGMRVIMDIVIDHTGDVWGYKDAPEMIWNDGQRFDFGYWRNANGEEVRIDANGSLQSPAAPGSRGAGGVRVLSPDDGIHPIEFQHPNAFKRMGRMRHIGKAVGDEATDGDFGILKALDLGNPEVLDTIIRCYKYWIAAADVDGYRIDAFRHIRPHDAAMFCHAIREFATRVGKKNFLMIGEVAAAPEEIAKYVGSNAPYPGEGDYAEYPLIESCLDFPLYNELAAVIKGRHTPEKLRERYEFLRAYYRDFDQAGKNYVIFAENHDGGAGSTFKRLMHGEDDPQLAVCAAAFLLTSLGIPCLYYGSEQAFDGGGEDDRYVRECMFGGNFGAFDTVGAHFFNPDHPVYRATAELARVRRETPALRYGRQYFRQISGDGTNFGHPAVAGKFTLAYSRVFDTEELLVAMNLDTEPRHDCVMLDAMTTPAGGQLRDLLGKLKDVTVEKGPKGESFVRLPLGPRQVVILSPA